MMKEISKKVIFGLSMLLSGIAGFLVTESKGSSTPHVDSLLEKPIFSIDTAHADGGGGDCCCGCDSGGGTAPPEPTSAWVYIDIDEY